LGLFKIWLIFVIHKIVDDPGTLDGFRAEAVKLNTRRPIVAAAAELLQLWDDVRGAAGGGLGSGLP